MEKEKSEVTTIEKLDELIRVAKAATPGPWSWQREESPKGTVYQHVLAVGPDNPRRGDGICHTYFSEQIGPLLAGPFVGQSIKAKPGRKEDAVFIAKSNPAAFIALVESLREAVEEMRVSVARADDHGDSYITEPIRNALASIAARTEKI